MKMMSMLAPIYLFILLNCGNSSNNNIEKNTVVDTNYFETISNISHDTLSAGDTFNLFKSYNFEESEWKLAFYAMSDEVIGSSMFEFVHKKTIKDSKSIKNFALKSEVIYKGYDMSTPEVYLFLIKGVDTVFFTGLILNNQDIIAFQNAEYGFTPTIEKINLTQYIKRY